MKQNFKIFIYLANATTKGAIISMEKIKHDYILYIILLIITIILTLISLNSSPLYNGSLSVDSSVFIVMAKGLLNHQIIYKDLFDHKGPIIYIINLIAILINKDFGLYIVETLLIYINIIFIYKIAKLILKKAKMSVYLLICSIYYLLFFIFISGGNLTEEYADVFISIGLYYILGILNIDIFNKKNWIMVGMMFSIVVLIKPSYIALWIAFGVIALIFFIKEKKYRELLKRHFICYNWHINYTNTNINIFHNKQLFIRFYIFNIYNEYKIFRSFNKNKVYSFLKFIFNK